MKHKTNKQIVTNNQMYLIVHYIKIELDWINVTRFSLYVTKRVIFHIYLDMITKKLFSIVSVRLLINYNSSLACVVLSVGFFGAIVGSSNDDGKLRTPRALTTNAENDEIQLPMNRFDLLKMIKSKCGFFSTARNADILSRLSPSFNSAII